MEATSVDPALLARARARVGAFVDAWQLEALLSVGPSSALYAVRDEDGTRAVSKLAHAKGATDVLGAARAALRLRHPARVAVLGVGETDEGLRYVLFERVEGPSLDAVLRREGPLSLEAALAACVDVLFVVEAAHRARMIHGAVSASKVLTSERGIRVIDCGARPRTTAATVRFLPDLLDDETRPDVAAVGALLFELLGGTSARSTEAVRAVANAAARDVPAHAAYATALGDAIERALDGRYATARAFRETLASLGDGLAWNAAIADLVVPSTPAPARPLRSGPVPRPNLARLDALPDDDVAAG